MKRTELPKAQEALFEMPEEVKGGPLAQRFLLPPFSILDARQGAWQERKREWLALGIRSEVGRGGAQGEKMAGRTWGQDLMRHEHVVGEKA